MGKNNQQRRAERKRKAASSQQRARTAWSRPDPPGPAGSAPSSGRIRSEDEERALRIEQLVAVGSRAAFGTDSDATLLEHTVDSLVDIDGIEGDGRHRPDRVISTYILQRLAALWERGWQPVDVVHVVRREWNQRLARLVTAAIAEEARLAQSFDRAPQDWLAQLAAIGVDPPSSAPAEGFWAGLGPAPTEWESALLTRWRKAEGFSTADVISDGLSLLSHLVRTPKILPLGDPPSAWGRASASRSDPARAVRDPKVLATIRALLAKAESTTFTAEAEAFTAKAQDMMTRHAIDAAVLAATDGRDLRHEVRPRRIHIDNPYAAEKAQLLGSVAYVNSVRIVWDNSLGFATAVGFPVDSELVELLFTSLLIQATRSMSDATGSSNRSRSPSFRRAFLVSYADRILERLEQARIHAGTEAALEYGSSLLPILANRKDIVADVTEALFPGTSPMRTRRVDAQGWHAGRLAADMASLATGRDEIRR